MKILVVDDERNIRRLAEYNLQKLGYQVLLAETGEEGLELARQECPDLILQDVMLPGMSGIDALKAYRGDAATTSTPVIMMTARSQRSDVEEALEAGADGYLTKPFDPLRFGDLVREYLDS